MTTLLTPEKITIVILVLLLLKILHAWLTAEQVLHWYQQHHEGKAPVSHDRFSRLLLHLISFPFKD